MKDRTEARVASCLSLAKKEKKKNARSKKEARCIAKHLEAAVAYACVFLESEW